MALFQRNQQSTEVNKLFTMGQSITILVVGLGNPGKEYLKTRHNIGFECVDEFAKRSGFTNWQEKKSFKSLMINGTVEEHRVIIIKPTTFMNESGVAIKSVMEFFRIPADQVIVVHDELDIPFGTIRGSFGGSSAGHNGIKSIIEHAGEHFERIRVGIGPKTPKQIEGADFVLGKFSKDQLSKLDDLTDEVSAMITERVFTGKLALEDRRFILQ